MTINDEATARSNADGALSTRIGKVETSYSGAGNLLTNTDFANGSSAGWSFFQEGAGTYDNRLVNVPNDDWRPQNENVLTLRQLGSVGSGDPIAGWTSTRFSVSAGQWLQFYAFTASHRSNGYESNLNFYKADGSSAGVAWTGRQSNIASGGRDIGAYRQLGLLATQVPAGAVAAEMQVRKFDTASGQSDSWLWITRPYVGYARQGQTEWNPYSPGSAGAVIIATNARLTTEETARANADTALSNRATALESSVNNGTTGVAATYAKISAEETTRSNADSALSTRTGALESSVNGANGSKSLQAQISDNLTTLTNANSAISGRTSTLETRSSQIPVSFTAVARGLGGNSPGKEFGIYDATGNRIWAGGGMWNVVTFNSSNQIDEGYTFNTLGSATDRINMANFIASRPAGKTIVCFTYDEPQSNRFENGLGPALDSMGAGPLYHSDKFQYRGAYVLVGRAGVGYGNGVEAYSGSSSGSADAWAEVRFDLLKGIPTLNGAGRGTTEAFAKVTDEAKARSDADTALSNRISTTESKLSLGTDSELYARIRTEETTRSNADSALASRTSKIESSYNTTSGGVSTNERFANWPDGQRNPTGWIDWSTEGAYTISRTGGFGGSPYSAYTQHNANAECGFYQTVSTWAGKWVVEVTARRDSGSLSGSGVTLSGTYNLDFLSDPDTNGQIRDSNDNETRTWVKLFDITQQSLNLHAMAGWSGFGRSRASNYITWFKLNLRPAGPGDLLGVKNAADLVSTNARIAAEETTRANADSALASRTNVVEAQISNDSVNLLRNGMFNAPGWTTGVPPSWSLWAADGSQYINPTTYFRSNYGATSPLQIDRNGNNSGVSQNIGTQAAGWYVLEADITTESGNWTGCGVHINFNNGYTRNFHFGSEPDTNGGVVTGNIGTVNRKFSTMFYNGAVGNNVMFYLMAGWEGFATGQGFLRTIWHKAVVRAASDAEIKAQKVSDSNLVARVTTTEQTLASAGNLAARWKINAETPGANAFITAEAVTSNGVAVSNVSIGGTAVNLVNTDGSTARKALTVENGVVTVYGALRAGASITLGSGTGWPVALASKDFSVSNGEYVGFGTTLDSLPNLTFAGNGLVALNSGETYRLYAENLTRDGFTARLEISVPAQPSNYDLSSGQYSGSGLRIIDKYPRADSTSNAYNVTVTGYITATAYSNGDTYCIWTEAYTFTGKKGYELAEGDLLMVMEDDGSYAPAPIEEIAFNKEHCITLRSASGIELTVSRSTPVTLRDGTSIKATEVQGHELPVLDGDDFRWEEIVAVEDAGERPVARIYVGDKTFAAGNTKGRSIFTHNLPVNKN